MPRQVRIEYPGARYPVMCRGDRREPIFDDDIMLNRSSDRGSTWLPAATHLDDLVGAPVAPVP